MTAAIAVVVLVALALVAWFLLRQGAVFQKLFSADSYRELAAWMPGAKAEAAAKAEAPAEAIKKGDPRMALTAAGLLVFYTAVRDGEIYRHHISVSMPGGHTPFAVGATFTAYVAERLGWDLGRATFFFTQKSVYHGEIEMTESEHRAWAERPVPSEVAADEHQRAIAVRGRVTFTRVELPALPAQG